MRHGRERIRRYTQEAVLEVDERLIGVQFVLTDIIQIGDDVLVGFADLTDFHDLRVVVLDELLDAAFEHIVRIQPVNAVLVHILQKSLLAAVAYEQIAQVPPRMLRKQRHDHIRLPGLLVEADEIGMLHLGFMEGAVTGFDSFLNGGFPVIVPVPLVAHQRG